MRHLSLIRRESVRQRIMMSEQAATLAERIDADLKQAMRDRNDTAKLTLRALKTALMQARTSGAQMHDLSETDVVEIVRREAKRRRDAADEFQKLGSPERAASELAEYQVLLQYLPNNFRKQKSKPLCVRSLRSSAPRPSSSLGRSCRRVR
ncbi:MAG: GatB/YqeY domain-containing protein [Anaerolineales bacterium]|nr:GatB/YqeY domain-containing protein [Anaerolineales bacterium]